MSREIFRKHRNFSNRAFKIDSKRTVRLHTNLYMAATYTVIREVKTPDKIFYKKSGKKSLDVSSLLAGGHLLNSPSNQTIA